MTILITGASGFIGSFIVEEALQRGFEVWAGIRATSSRKYLYDERIHFAEIDLSSAEKLGQQLRTLRKEMGGRGWDYVVHAAGATKCRNTEEFFKTNTRGTENLVWALKSEGMVPQRFVFVSSLSIFGAICETPIRKKTAENPWIYEPIRLSDQPKPNTAYGRSKLLAEEFLQHVQDFPFVILRPTGVYGPREQDYFLMAKSIKQHSDFSVGFKQQEITFIYVRDLVAAILLALTAEGVEGKAYFLSDGEVYNSRRFSDLLQSEMGNPWVLRIKAPLWLLKTICTISGKISGWMGKTSTLNPDKYHILSQRNWQCDIEPARRELGYQPEWPLERGVPETVAWYKANGWL